MTDAAPLVTVLIPARNEAEDIAACLEAVAAQDLPLDRIEVVVVDGASSDETATVARAALARSPFARGIVVENPEATTPSNLNAGLAAATGELLVRVDARSRIPTDYVRRCAEVLAAEPGVVVVGGAQVAIPRAPTALGIGVARALNNRWGMGFSRYRRGAASGPADTVYLGAFRTADVASIGGWDPFFTTNQDFDLNRRLGATGVVWFEAGVDVGYVPRRHLTDLWRQYHRFGRWKAAYWARTQDKPQPRQVVLVVGPLVALAAGSLVLARGRHRPALLLAAAAGATAFELTGPTSPVGSTVTPAARAVSLAASFAVAAGWLSGVWSGLAGWLLRRSARG